MKKIQKSSQADFWFQFLGLLCKVFHFAHFFNCFSSFWQLFGILGGILLDFPFFYRMKKSYIFEKPSWPLVFLAANTPHFHSPSSVPKPPQPLPPQPVELPSRQTHGIVARSSSSSSSDASCCKPGGQHVAWMREDAWLHRVMAAQWGRRPQSMVRSRHITVVLPAPSHITES